MKIKVCGLYDLANLRDVLSLKPDFIGLNFYPNSKRFCRFSVLPDLDFALTKLVGVFVNSSLAEIVEQTKRFNLSYLQFHGTESKDELVAIKAVLPAAKIIKVFGVEEPNDLKDLGSWQDHVDYFLFDNKSISFGGTGKKFNWDILNSNLPQKQFFLAGGIGLEDARSLKALNKVLPDFFAVDINSRFEDKIGLKEIERIQKFIEEIRE